jgi:hypothetical protein
LQLVTPAGLEQRDRDIRAQGQARQPGIAQRTGGRRAQHARRQHAARDEGVDDEAAPEFLAQDREIAEVRCDAAVRFGHGHREPAKLGKARERVDAAAGRPFASLCQVRFLHHPAICAGGQHHLLDSGAEVHA